MELDNTKLQLMGIQGWEVSHPERIRCQHQPKITIPDDCQLLFVSSSCPTGELAEFYQKILKAMKLTLADTRHILPEHLQFVQASENLVWLWFAGDSHADSHLTEFQERLAIQGKPSMQGLPSTQGKLQTLTSPLLSSVQQSDGEKRQLWNQIRAYG
ncbi:DNA polymerase III subunit psi [Vibrio hippocampi]|uniref:DNA polymerase III subunit psi n=1 Tax=Vibrio hippocampi TaxID=654686 RepID=A0ABN8DGN8_9VIBR|nr:DNA polymerase III subunit psi [Vibrio hippocampi]CAH0526759.1 hypothetical protein VHP8226_02131 [Vibrio hippocampi]